MRKYINTKRPLLYYLNISLYTIAFFVITIQDSKGQIAAEYLHNVEHVNLDQVKVTVDFNNTPFDEAILQLGQKGGIKFNYSTNVISDETKITYKAKNVSASKALTSVLPSNISYVTVRNSVILKKEELKYLPGFYQEIVTGQVTDTNTGETLPGVNIVAVGTQVGTSTDYEGSYSLNVPVEVDSLIFSYLGYDTQTVAINGRNNLDVALSADFQLLDEVVKVGYGTQKRTSITSSVSDIRSTDLQKKQISNTSQLLQGIAPGVTVLDEGGSPGRTDATIRIRGITSIGDSDPLIIVDGIEQPIRNINPDNIESISVLKDASSTAIYGSRAANGVVLISTKRAEEGALQVSYNGYYGVAESINRPTHMGTEDYMRLLNVANVNNERPIRFTEQEIQDHVNSNDRLQYPEPNVFWSDNSPILRTAPQMQNTINISGGSENARGLLSVRQKKEDGVIPNYGSNLGEVRINSDFQISPRVAMNADLNYNNTSSQQPIMNIPQFMLHATQFTVPKYPDGTYGLSELGYNPLIFIDLHGVNEWEGEYLVGNFKVELELMEGLNFSSQFARRTENNRTRQFNNAYEIRDYYDPTKVLQTNGPNSLSDTRGFDTERTLNNILLYTKSFRNHSTDALLGYSEVYHKRHIITGSRNNFHNNHVGSLGMGDQSTVDNAGSETEWGLRSFFGRFNYSYRDRYLIEANARVDGSSRFSRENRYGFFPSVSGAWRISEEFFWNIGSINEFKIRASWGKTGNQAVDLYQYFETLSTANYPFNNNLRSGFIQNNMANEDLTWETTTQLDIGLDAMLLENKIAFTFDYYQKRTDDILLRLPISTTIGLDTPYQNAGIVDNTGWEASLTYRNIEGQLQYNFSLNFSDNVNEVIDLKGTGPYITGSDINPKFATQEGLPINAHWGYKTDGLFQNYQEIEDATALFRPDTQPGDVNYVDLNGDGRIDSGDMTNIGIEFPRYIFGLTSDFAYRNFELNVQIQGVGKQDRRFAGGLIEGGAQPTFAHDVIKDYWTEDNRNARFPRPVAGDLSNYQNSDRLIIDASYIRLKRIQLGYNFEPRILNMLSLKNAKLYFNMTNLFTISNLNEWGLDPESPSGRASYYPQIGMYTIGMKIDY